VRITLIIKNPHGGGYNMATTKFLEAVAKKGHADKLTVGELACAIYEGMPHVQNLAEKLARQHSGAGALTWFDMNYPEVKNFYVHIAQQLIDHAQGWKPNQSGGCELTDEGLEKLKALPRHPAME
jgi:hypothetical protein